jgi:hypothetical protein
MEVPVLLTGEDGGKVVVKALPVRGDEKFTFMGTVFDHERVEIEYPGVDLMALHAQAAPSIQDRPERSR